MIRTTHHGFTLPEALAALVLVALVMPAALRVSGLAGGVGGLSADRMLAVELASSKIDELATTGQWQGSALAGGMTSPPSGLTLDEDQLALLERFTWAATVEPWTDVKMNILTVAINWQRRGNVHSVSLSTLVLADTQPAESDEVTE